MFSCMQNTVLLYKGKKSSVMFMEPILTYCLVNNCVR